MANAKKCDRCGNFYVPYTTKILKYDANGVSIIKRLSYNNNYEGMTTRDLCPECIHSFEKWYLEGNNNAED